MTLPPAAVITDIEGTTTPIAFVRGTLYPFARARLEAALALPENASIAAEVARMVPDRPVLDTLNRWMDEDARVNPLKVLQGRIWDAGYADGSLKGALYPDVTPALRRWVRAGLRLYVYSSGAVAAQKALFGNSVEGDITGFFNGFFDTNIGGKKDSESYDRLCIGINVPPAEVLFLSDLEAELDAAASAGLRTCQLVRPEDATVASDRHATAPNFPAAAKAFGL
jgi:enolase-phosphatase E1